MSSCLLPTPLVSMVQLGFRSVGPWQTQVIVDNQCLGHARFLLARDFDAPKAADASEHVITSDTKSAIMSGYKNEPRATILVRTGEHEAKLLRCPDQSQIVAKMAKGGQGLLLEVSDGVEVRDFAAAATMPSGLMHITYPKAEVDASHSTKVAVEESGASMV